MSGRKRGFTSAGGRHGLKKQKLTSLSKELISSTKNTKKLQARDEERLKKVINKKADKRETHARIPYNRAMHILTIGEGNFSFTRALLEHFQAQEKLAQSQPDSSSQHSAPLGDLEDDDVGDGVKREDKLMPKKFRKAGFHPDQHRPFLPPNSLFTNADIRLVATCYDSMNELAFKYPDVGANLALLHESNIPVYANVDALNLDKVHKRPIVEEKLGVAIQKGKEWAKSHTEPNPDDEDEDEPNDDDEETMEDGDASTSSSSSKSKSKSKSASNSSPQSSLLFSPFVTQRTFYGVQKIIKGKLHGSAKKKYSEKLEKAAQLEEEEEQPTGVDNTAPDSKSKKKSTSTSQQRRAALTSHHLSMINSEPRTRFHRIIFNFPHTGCGIKDTDQNNAYHREFLTQFFTNVSATRLVYPADEFGEVHVTLKKGEPYKSWNIQQCARNGGFTFKTSYEFFPHLYKGYQHRRTRGHDDEREIDLASGSIIGANSDIHAGAMTYVFTRARTWMDDEEEKFDQEWAKKYSVQHEEDVVRQQLLQECERIYRETKRKHDEKKASEEGESEEENIDQQESDDDQVEEQPSEDESNQPAVEHEADEVADQPVDSVDVVMDEDEDDSPKISPIVPNFAAAFRSHFQARAAPSALAFKSQSNKGTNKKAKLSGFKRK